MSKILEVPIFLAKDWERMKMGMWNESNQYYSTVLFGISKNICTMKELLSEFINKLNWTLKLGRWPFKSIIKNIPAYL